MACFNNMPTDEEASGANVQRRLPHGNSRGPGRTRRRAGGGGRTTKSGGHRCSTSGEGQWYSGNYSRLQALFTAHKGMAPSPSTVGTAASPLPAHPSSFSSMVNFFGADIFLLWKAALLKKRILFFSPVPIEQGCMRVRWIDRMLGLQNGDSIAASSLMYYINVFDIDRLSTMDSYIACTSEKIFQEKPQLCVSISKSSRSVASCRLQTPSCSQELTRSEREQTIFTSATVRSLSSPELKNAQTTPVDSSRYALLTSQRT